MAKLRWLFVFSVLLNIALADIQVISESDLSSNEIPLEVDGKGLLDPIIQVLIKGVLDKISESLKGDESAGIPPLDPLYIRDIILENVDNNLLSGSLSLTDLKIEGHSEFTSIVNTEKNGREVDIILNFGVLRLDAGYDASLKLFQKIDLFGNGNIDLKFKEFICTVVLKLDLSYPTLKEVLALKLEVTPPSAEVQITGLFNDEFMSKLVSLQMTRTISAFLKFYQDDVNKILVKIMDFIRKEINKLLQVPEPDKVYSEEQLRELLQQIVKRVITRLSEENEHYIKLFHNLLSKHT